MAIDPFRIFTFLTDDPAIFNPQLDTSMLMMQVVQQQGYHAAYFTLADMFYDSGVVKAKLKVLVADFHAHYEMRVAEEITVNLAECGAVVIRKDPPFDQAYLYATYLLDIVTAQGGCVSNPSESVRNSNEKVFALHFPSLIPESIISQNILELKTFIQKYGKAVLKPLNAMAGQDVLLVSAEDLTLNSLLGVMTEHQHRAIIAQRFLPEIKTHGDKRIFFVGGEPMPYTLLRLPASDDFRANFAAGGHAKIFDLTEDDKKLCAVLQPELKKRQLDLVGIDVIGGYLTEINVTSPTGLKFVFTETGFNMVEVWLKSIDARRKNR